MMLGTTNIKNKGLKIYTRRQPW